MNHDQHQRAQELYLQAMDREPKERLAYVASQVGRDSALFAELEPLLRLAEDDDRLNAPVSPVLLSDMFERPETIGDYEITGVLGEGGMGIVYEARQQNPQRTVALKVLRFNGSAESLRRFKHEAEVLAFLQHPNIAHVYEAGVTAGALGEQPFFSMELVEGVRIDQYAKEQALSHNACVRLLRGVLDGIAHAHRKGVVHRDLKPANLLVQNDGQPKILDFGVARVAALEGQSEDSLRTRTGEVIGTLAYMSPEQVAGDPSLVDTRSDIYALGVCLYRLLSGENPIDLEGTNTVEALRRVSEEAPRPLARLAHDVEEDLATIVHKALAKERERRYASADDFSADLERYLQRKPILARAPSALYVAKRFVQRNRAVTAAGGFALLALAAGTVVSTTLYLREQRANEDLVIAKEGLEKSNEALAQSNTSLTEANQLADERLAAANRRLAELDTSTSLITNLFGDPLPYEDGESLLFSTVVARSTKKVLEGLHDVPLQRAWLALALGNHARHIGLTEDARKLLDAGRESYAATSEEQPQVTLQLDYLESSLLMSERRYTEALKHWKRMLETDYSVPATTQLGLRVRAYHQMGLCLQELGQREECLDYLQRSLALARQSDEGDKNQIPGIQLLMVDSHLTHGEFELARQLAQECLDDLESEEVEQPVEVSNALTALGAALINLDRLPEARTAMEEAVRSTEGFAGPSHPLLAERKGDLASLRRRMGDPAGALSLYSEAIEALRDAGVKMANELGGLLGNRADLLISLGRLEEAEADLDESLIVLRVSEGVSAEVARAFLKSYRASIYIARGDLDGAENLCREAISDKRAIFGTENHPVLQLDFTGLAQIAFLRGDFVGCIEQEIENARRAAMIYGPDHPAIAMRFNQARRILERYEALPEHDTELAEELRGVIEDQRL